MPPMPDEQAPIVIPAVSVAIVRDGKVLLVRRGRAPSKGLYAFPGGRVEAGESLEEAARRELREETGLVAGALEPIDLLRFEAEGREPPTVYELQVFAALPAAGEPVAGDDADLVGWFGIDEMAALPMTDSTHVIARRLLGVG